MQGNMIVEKVGSSNLGAVMSFLKTEGLFVKSTNKRILNRMNSDVYNATGFLTGSETLSYCMLINGKVIGLILADGFNASDSVFIDYILVDRNYRYQGIANTLMSRMLMQCDSRPIFVESDVYNEDYWTRLGFSKVEIEYKQPKLKDNPENNFIDLMVISKVGISRLMRDDLAECLTDYFNVCYEGDFNRKEFIKNIIGDNDRITVTRKRR